MSRRGVTRSRVSWSWSRVTVGPSRGTWSVALINMNMHEMMMRGLRLRETATVTANLGCGTMQRVGTVVSGRGYFQGPSPSITASSCSRRNRVGMGIGIGM
jgi:hypothetical protein